MAAYRVVVEKDYLVFAAGHFITYGDQCEGLHGHNYRARVEVEGELDENSYVFDFVTLKRIMRRLLARRRRFAPLPASAAGRDGRSGGGHGRRR